MENKVFLDMKFNRVIGVIGLPIIQKRVEDVYVYKAGTLLP